MMNVGNPPFRNRRRGGEANQMPVCHVVLPAEETEIEPSAEELDNIMRAQRRDLCCNQKHALLYKDSGCCIATPGSRPLAPPPASLHKHPYPAAGVRLLMGCCAGVTFMCELIQRGRTVKAWLEPRGEGVARKGSKNGGREVNEWKVLHEGENEREEQLNEGVTGTG